MPELPEVETIARQLNPFVRGRRLWALRVFDAKLDPGRCRGLRSRVLDRVFRVGKQVVFEARHPPAELPAAWLVVHLRMTGRLIWVPRHSVGLRRHTRALLELEGGGVHFIDARRFGTMRWVKDLARVLPRGIEPLSAAFTQRALARRLAGSRQQLKIWLLRQDRLVGLGNIYASEILFRAALSPFRTAGGLSPDEIRDLHRAVRGVLREAIEACGTTFSDFQDARGELGSYQACLAVYGREGAGCPRCEEAIHRVVQAQRSTYYCAKCQGDPGGERTGQ